MSPRLAVRSKASTLNSKLPLQSKESLSNIFDEGCEISSSHGGEYDVQSCLLGCTAAPLKRRSTIILHGSTTQKTALNIFDEVRKVTESFSVLIIGYIKK
jgi:hypothetical protein